jgi:hypothetical protein
VAKIIHRQSSFSSIEGVIYAASNAQSSFTLRNFTVSGVSINDETSIIKLGTISDLYINGITVYNSGPENSGNENTLIDLTDLVTSVDCKYAISNINLTQSEITVVRIDNIYQSNTINSTIVVTNLLYQNTFFEFATNLIVTERVKSQNSFSAVFSNITFINLDFDKGGNLMLLQHQSPDQFEFTNVTFSNLTFSGISVEMFDKQAEDQVKVKFSNMKASQIDAKFRSFIQLNTGVDLEISDSEFYNIGNLRTGAVLFAGSQKTVTNIYNSKFFNITAIEGAVFAAEEQSVIKCYNCSFTNNFAIGSGAFKANRDGYFHVYDSVITGNKALYAAVSEVFSTQFMSIISNSTISTNFALSKSEIESDILTQSMLQFLTL